MTPCSVSTAPARTGNNPLKDNTVLNPIEAQELTALYHERWEIENVFDEFKTHLRGSNTVLRSKTPEMVQQELWWLLLAHFAIRQLMAQAA